MTDVSLLLLEVLQNSSSAEAKRIDVELVCEQNFIKFIVTDDGIGIDNANLLLLNDGKFSSSNGRGKGLKLVKEKTDFCGGEFFISSKVGKGTKVTAYFKRVSDLTLGDISASLVAYICPEFELGFSYLAGGRVFSTSTGELYARYQDRLFYPKVLRQIRDEIIENIDKINGGLTI